MTIFIYSIIIVAGLGLLLGLALSLADKYISVPVNEKEGQVLALLSGANCGSCGFAGCAAMAKALSEGKADISACPVASSEARQKISALLGTQAKTAEPTSAFIGCNGGVRCVDRGEYTGISDCNAAMASSIKGCSYACIGLMSCQKVCPTNAIFKNEFGVAEVDRNLCISCGLCVKECPKKIIKILPIHTKVYVCCSSNDFGKTVKDNCSVGCIGCKLCEKVCEVNAIKVVNNIPIIDNDICNGCNKCIERCPTKTLRAQ